MIVLATALRTARALALVLLLVALGAPGARADLLREVEGWWGLDPDGCFDDVDNQARVAVGRFEVTQAGVGFGSGGFAVGFYESTCYFEDAQASDDVISGATTCYSEGEEYRGWGWILRENAFTLRLFLPEGIGGGHPFVRCGALTRERLVR
ncbi:hypothetical protein [Salinarimonas rosea]|uniref:hypothetical protein n=1 Tax=Salinarimonas rosea TaxID=552063 RepID=UPI000413CFC9|nr:hypothetical protein [Salinarimonas rosea]